MIKKTSNIVFGIAAATAMLIASTSNAQTGTLFGINSLSTGEQLVAIDTGTGQGTVIGTTGVDSITGLAFDASTGTLFGFGRNTGNELFTLNTQTGAATPLGTINFNTNFTLVPASLAIDPLTGTFFGFDDNSNQLITIEPNFLTGAPEATPVGPTGSGFNNVAGLAFNASGALFGIDAFVNVFIQIDTGSGAGTQISPTGATGSFASNALTFDPGSNRFFTTRSVASGTVPGAFRGEDQLISLTPNSAGFSEVGLTGFANIQALAFVPSTANVPEPTTGLLLCLAGASGLAYRRRV